MVKVQIPGVSIGPVVLNRGQLLDIWLLTVHVVIPPISIQLIPRITLWEPFVLFDTNDIVKGITEMITAIPKTLVNLAVAWIEKQVEDYEKDHQE